MMGVGSRVVRGLQVGSFVNCDDNSGCKYAQIIGVLGWKARRGRVPKVGVGDLVIIASKKGTPQMKKKIERAVVVRQRKEFRRPNGTRIMFEDNAVVLIDDQGLPKGTEIKGAIAREVAERYPKVAGIAAAVV